MSITAGRLFPNPGLYWLEGKQGTQMVMKARSGLLIGIAPQAREAEPGFAFFAAGTDADDEDVDPYTLKLELDELRDLNTQITKVIKALEEAGP